MTGGYMSKYTGKCDFYDTVYMIHGVDVILKTADIYYGDAKVEAKEENDLFPYSTHLIASMGSNPEGKVINLSQNSFIDDEEKDFLSWRIQDCIKLARKAKKEKKAFTYDYVKSNTEDSSLEEAPYKLIVSIINSSPDVVKFHIPKDYRAARRVVEDFLIPTYFPTVHLARFNKEREDFLKDAQKRGFRVMMPVEKCFEFSEGKYHPAIFHMCWKVVEYYDSVNKFEGDNND